MRVHASGTDLFGQFDERCSVFVTDAITSEKNCAVQL